MAKKKTFTVGSCGLENQRIKLTQTLSRASVRLGLSLAKKKMEISIFGFGPPPLPKMEKWNKKKLHFAFLWRFHP